MILIIDNYDSFTYNLYQYIAEISTEEIKIVRNDCISLDEIHQLNPTKIVLSPGPKKPIDAGICIELVKYYYKTVPIFGICLGHQAIIEAFGGLIQKTKHVMHGKTSEIQILKNSKLYTHFPNTFIATRYHSLVGVKDKLPNELSIISETEDHVIMGVEHKIYPVYGCQYHPESILTEFGKEHFRNFLTIKAQVLE
jgi:anthranilate synthase component 2